MSRKLVISFSIIVSVVILIISENCIVMASSAGKLPAILDNKNGLVIQKIADGLDEPSGFEFVGKKDILITQKDDGKVKLIRNFDLKKYSILDVNVFNHTRDSGLSGITSTTISNKRYVFLFYTENPVNDVDRISSRLPENDNRIYRYVWDPDSLALFNETLVLDLPSTSSANNNGGKIIIGPDKQLYTLISGLNSEGTGRNMPEEDSPKYWLYDNKSESAAVLRTTLDGVPTKNNPSTEKGFESFFGYGIRNSFGLGFDPVTGNLWVIEEGSRLLDEINLIKPGFNSGWKQTQENSSEKCCYNKGADSTLSQNSSSLYDINGSQYYEPEFVSRNPSFLSSILFMNSSALGNEYNNDLFVGEMQGKIHHFALNKNRESIVIKNGSSDALLATGFGSISDLKIGPDNALYVLTFANNTGIPLEKNSGSLYRIAKSSINLPVVDSRAITADYMWLVSTVIIITAIAIFRTYFNKQSSKDP